MVNESFIILSGDTPEEKRTEDLKTVLNLLRIPFIPVKGMYNGVEEDAVLVRPDPSILFFVALAKHFNQESILVNNLWDTNLTVLVFVEDKPDIVLGKFVEIPVENVHYHQSWSLINGKYYTTEVENETHTSVN